MYFQDGILIIFSRKDSVIKPLEGNFLTKFSLKRSLDLLLEQMLWLPSLKVIRKEAKQMKHEKMVEEKYQEWGVEKEGKTWMIKHEKMVGVSRICLSTPLRNTSITLSVKPKIFIVVVSGLHGHPYLFLYFKILPLLSYKFCYSWTLLLTISITKCSGITLARPWLHTVLCHGLSGSLTSLKHEVGLKN